MISVAWPYICSSLLQVSLHFEQWRQRELKGGWRKKSRDAVKWTRQCVASVKVSER